MYSYKAGHALSNLNVQSLYNFFRFTKIGRGVTLDGRPSGSLDPQLQLLLLLLQASCVLYPQELHCDLPLGGGHLLV